jgi:hypothetical protein
VMAIDTLVDGVARQKILLDLSTDSHWGGSTQRLLASKVADPTWLTFGRSGVEVVLG